ncbi:MAG: hypothetical protein ACRC7R_12185 [Sarcina sp.]
MKSVSGISMVHACIALEKELINKQSANIDTITGTTGSMENFKKLAEKLLENVKEGKTDKTTIDMK